MNAHFLKLLGPWNNNELNNKKEFGASDIERYNKRNDMLKLHFNRFNNLECYSKYLNLSRKYSVLDFSCGNGATMEIFRHFNNNVTGVDYRDNHLYKHYIESQNLLKNYTEHDGKNIPYPFKNNQFDMTICWGALYHYEAGPTDNSIKFIDEFTRISTDLVVIALNSVKHRSQDMINKDREFKKLLINYNNNNFKLLHELKGYIFILKSNNK